MEMTMHFPLLLLICSLCSAQLQTESDNEVIPLAKETEPQRREPTNASDRQQTCVQDIHAVVREMSIALAEQRVEIKHLQRDNEAQAAKLRELELQKTEVDKLKQQLQAQATKLKEVDLQKTELDLQKTEVVKLKQQLQVQTNKLKELDLQKTELEKQKQQLQAQTAELITIKARANVTENQVEALKRDGEVKQVAFSASLFASGSLSAHLGPFNTVTLLVFRHVFANIGNAYNPNTDDATDDTPFIFSVKKCHTGFFIAPVRGAYHFEFHIGSGGHASHASAAWLIKNGEHISTAYALQPSGHVTAANGANLLLEVGDVVFLQQWANTKIYDNGNHHTSFSGHLLFTM